MRRLPRRFRRALLTALVLPVLVSAAAAASAEDGGEPAFDVELQAGVGGALLAGQAHKGLGADYDDLWGRGETFWLAAGGSVPIAAGEGLGLNLGLSLQFDYTRHPDGDSWMHRTGAVVAPDAIHAYRLLGGFDLPVRFGALNAPVRFRVGPRLLVGYAYTPSVYATVWDSSAPFAMRFYRSTDSIAFDVTMRAGVTFDLGGRLHAGIVLFAGFSSHGAPEGSNTFFGPALPAEMNTLQYGIAVVCRFRSALPHDASARLADDTAAR